MLPGTYRVAARHCRTHEVIWEEEVVVHSGSGVTEHSLISTSKMAAQIEGPLGVTNAATASWSIELVP